MIRGIIRWWATDGDASDQSESALVTELNRLEIAWSDFSSRTMVLTFPGDSNAARVAFDSLEGWLASWQAEVTSHNLEFHAVLVATRDNAFVRI
jgi:hypothetical protein